MGRTNLNDTNPAAPAGGKNVLWQVTAYTGYDRDASAYIMLASTTEMGLCPILPNDATKFLDGTGIFDTVKDSDLSTSDITTNNATTAKHGFIKKLDNDATHYMDGQGNWTSPAAGSGWSGTVINKSTTYTAVANDVIRADTSGAGFTITIPLSASNANKVIVVKKVSTDTNLVTLARSGADLLEGATSLTFDAPGMSLMLISDGAGNWEIY